jgi:hypothetical protein
MKKFVLFACLLLALTVTACGNNASKSTASKEKASSKTTQSSAESKKTNPLDQLSKAFGKMGKVKSFRAKTTSNGMDITMEFASPDRFHMIAGQTETYLIGGTFYMKLGDQWQKMEAPQGSDFGVVDVKELQGDFDAAIDKKYIGAEDLDGSPTLIYEYTVTVKKPNPCTSTSKIWVGVADGLPRRIESSTKIDGTTVSVVTDYYDYNKVSIEPPN